MIKRVISLIALILLNVSCLTCCIGSEQRQTSTMQTTTPTQTSTTATTTTQSQRDKQNFTNLLAEFRQQDHAINDCNKKLKFLKFFNSKAFPALTGFLTAGITGGICYLLKYSRPKIALFSGILGATSLIGTKVLRWLHTKMIDPTKQLREHSQNKASQLRNTEKDIRTYYDKFRETPTYLREILAIEKNSKLRQILLGMLPVT